MVARSPAVACRALLALCSLALLAEPRLARAADQPPAPAAAMPASGPGAEMMQAMLKMETEAASVLMTGDPDADFAAMMIPHHQAAIDMATIELRDGHDPHMRRLARSIITAQQKEIADMRAWLAKHPK